MRIQDINLGTKLTIIAVASAAAAILCVVIAFVVQDLRLVNRIKNEQAQSHNLLIATNLSIALNESHPQLVDELLHASTSDHGIIAAAVVSANSTLYASHQLPSLEKNQTVTEGFFERYLQQNRYAFPVSIHQTPIPLSNGETATLVTFMSRFDVQQRIGFMAGYSAMAIVLALFIAFTISWLVQRMVSNPIRNLISLFREVKRSANYGLRTEIVGNDELGELALGFNDMLEQIQSRDKNLEKQVRQRTRELESLAEAFRYRALHDTLTGLPNRALLQEEFYRAVAHANRSGKYFSIMLMDLDNFKYINDSFGHDFGDELLKEVAQHIQRVVRGEDRVCRLGGDEFVVLMEGIDSEATVRSIGENLLQDLHNEIRVREKIIRISVSIGASIYPRHGGQLMDLKRKADIAMYASKAAGKNRLTVFESAMEQEALHRLLVQNDLAAAIEKGELDIDYQPQVDIDAGKLIAAEALVRWRHPDYGILKPKEFIGFAEDNGLIRAIDYYVLEHACQQSACWLKALSRCIPVSVNLSGIHFRSMEVVDKIRDTLQAQAIEGPHLIVELTKPILGEDEMIMRRVIDAIRMQGVRVALDNFGVAGSSLHYLRSFRVDILKLDKSFSRFVDKSLHEKKLAKGIISMADHSGVALVAEGVESESQANSLASLGCHIMQGYWYTKPCNSHNFERWLEDFDRGHAA